MVFWWHTLIKAYVWAHTRVLCSWGSVMRRTRPSSGSGPAPRDSITRSCPDVCGPIRAAPSHATLAWSSSATATLPRPGAATTPQGASDWQRRPCSWRNRASGSLSALGRSIQTGPWWRWTLRGDGCPCLSVHPQVSITETLTHISAYTSSQVTFIYIALLTIQIVSKQLHNIKIGK